MRSIKMDFVRGGGDTSVLTKGMTYHVVIASTQHRQFSSPLDQESFLDALAALRYDQAFTEDQQTTESDACREVNGAGVGLWRGQQQREPCHREVDQRKRKYLEGVIPTA